MKVGIVVCRSFIKKPFQALCQMEQLLMQQTAANYDLLLFPQTYLQGIYSLNNDKAEAVKIAFRENCRLIGEIKKLCERYCVGVGFGYYEKDGKNAIYDSYILINREGKIRFRQRQLTQQWQEKTKSLPADLPVEKIDLDLLEPNKLLFEEETEFVKELEDEAALTKQAVPEVNFSKGEALSCGYFGGKQVVLLIGRDWENKEIVRACRDLEPDWVYCPTSLDIKNDEWANFVSKKFLPLADKLDTTVLLGNSYYIEDNSVKGGALGQIPNNKLEQLEPNCYDILAVEI